MWPVMHAGIETPVNRMTHRCKNITLPQTSFAGGKYQGVKKFTLVARLDISVHERILIFTCNSDPHKRELCIRGSKKQSVNHRGSSNVTPNSLWRKTFQFHISAEYLTNTTPILDKSSAWTYRECTIMCVEREVSDVDGAGCLGDHLGHPQHVPAVRHRHLRARELLQLLDAETIVPRLH